MLLISFRSRKKLAKSLFFSILLATIYKQKSAVLVEDIVLDLNPHRPFFSFNFESLGVQLLCHFYPYGT